jgi:uncharacterized membrane protein
LLNKIASFFILLLIIAVIAAITWISITPQKEKPLTEFYILGAQGKAQGYPDTIKINSPCNVIVGIVNRENELVEYHLVVKYGDLILNRLEPIRLADKQTWENPVSFALTKTGDNQKIDFILYKSDQSDPYLTLDILVNVK